MTLDMTGKSNDTQSPAAPSPQLWQNYPSAARMPGDMKRGGVPRVASAKIIQARYQARLNEALASDHPLRELSMIKITGEYRNHLNALMEDIKVEQRKAAATARRTSRVGDLDPATRPPTRPVGHIVKRTRRTSELVYEPAAASPPGDKQPALHEAQEALNRAVFRYIRVTIDDEPADSVLAAIRLAGMRLLIVREL